MNKAELSVDPIFLHIVREGQSKVSIVRKTIECVQAYEDNETYTHASKKEWYTQILFGSGNEIKLEGNRHKEITDLLYY